MSYCDICENCGKTLAKRQYDYMICQNCLENLQKICTHDHFISWDNKKYSFTACEFCWLYVSEDLMI